MTEQLPLDASPEQLSELAVTNPKLAVQHPNLTPAMFVSLAEDHPIEAMENPSLALWELEDPGFWARIEEDVSCNWLPHGVPLLSPVARVRFGLDILTHAESRFSLTFPYDLEYKKFAGLIHKWLRINSDISRESLISNRFHRLDTITRQNIYAKISDEIKLAFRVACRMATDANNFVYSFMMDAVAAAMDSTENIKATTQLSDCLGHVAGYSADYNSGSDNHLAARNREWVWHWRHLAANYLKRRKL